MKYYIELWRQSRKKDRRIHVVGPFPKLLGPYKHGRRAFRRLSEFKASGYDGIATLRKG